MTDPFPDWLADVAADGVVIVPKNVEVEARANLWHFGLDDGQRACVSAGGIEAFLRAVASARGEWLADRRAEPMWFYSWQDAMAGQLRFSLISATHERLPFGCPIRPISTPGPVILDFLAPRVAASDLPLNVWVLLVPQD